MLNIRNSSHKESDILTHIFEEDIDKETVDDSIDEDLNECEIDTQEVIDSVINVDNTAQAEDKLNISIAVSKLTEALTVIKTIKTNKVEVESLLNNHNYALNELLHRKLISKENLEEFGDIDKTIEDIVKHKAVLVDWLQLIELVEVNLQNVNSMRHIDRTLQALSEYDCKKIKYVYTKEDIDKLLDFNSI